MFWGTGLVSDAGYEANGRAEQHFTVKENPFKRRVRSTSSNLWEQVPREFGGESGDPILDSIL